MFPMVLLLGNVVPPSSPSISSKETKEAQANSLTSTHLAPLRYLHFEDMQFTQPGRHAQFTPFLVARNGLGAGALPPPLFWVGAKQLLFKNEGPEGVEA